MDSLPRLTARQLVRQDLPAVQALYAEMGRDGVWADIKTLETILKYGELWGGFYGEVLSFCCAITSSDIPCAQGQALSAMAPRYSMQLLNPAFLPVAQNGAARFFTLMRARLCQLNIQEKDIVACLPVKTGAPLLAGLFASHFVVTAMRPLYQLRAHYLFRLMPDFVASSGNGRVLLPLEDTLSVSRLLEHGFFATSVIKRQGVLLMGLETELSENPGM